MVRKIISNSLSLMKFAKIKKKITRIVSYVKRHPLAEKLKKEKSWAFTLYDLNHRAMLHEHIYNS